MRWVFPRGSCAGHGLGCHGVFDHDDGVGYLGAKMVHHTLQGAIFLGQLKLRREAFLLLGTKTWEPIGCYCTTFMVMYALTERRYNILREPVDRRPVHTDVPARVPSHGG